jgi:hypothetical protein
MKYRLTHLVAVTLLACLSVASALAETVRADFGGQPAGEPLKGAAFGKGAGAWQATANLRFGGGGDGGLTVENAAPFMGRVAVPAGAKVITAEADLCAAGPGWVALGIGAPHLGTPTWGKGLYVILKGNGSFTLFGNDDPDDWESKSAKGLKSGTVAGFVSQEPVNLRLMLETEGPKATLWVNGAKVVDGMSLAGRAFTVEPGFAGVSGFAQPSGSEVAKSFALTVSGEAGSAGPALPTVGMEPAISPAWWYMGDEVRFTVKGGKLPARAQSVAVTVYDVEGEVVREDILPKAEVESAGWGWTPARPGYYEAAFRWVDAEGKETEMGQTFALRAPNGNTRTFAHTREGFAVLPPQLPVNGPVGQFGFTYLLKPQLIPLAKLVGFDLANIHSIPWGAHFTNQKVAIEPVKGEYHWEHLDPHVDALEEAGFMISAQFCYTPTWASPYPEKTDKKICVIEANSYAPVNIGDYGRFVRDTVERYGDRIRIWELWNEPAMPGGSVFWSDTPENFVKLIEAGYTSIKDVQPDSEVWLGGLGPRAVYYAFFRRILELGAAPYFDVLSVHGRPPLEEFRRAEEMAGVAPKPVVNSEWHAILQNANQKTPLLSEQALSLRMMRKQMLQLKNGVRRSAFFEMANLVEPETLVWAGDNKWFVHSSGLFRSRPDVEPRQAAVVMANFLNLSAHQATFVQEFDAGKEIIALLLDTGRGPLAVFWSESGPVPVASVAAFASDGSALTDWEGKPIALGEGGMLRADRLYFLTAPDATTIAAAGAADNLVNLEWAKRQQVETVEHVYHNGALFEFVDDPADIPDAAWITGDWKLSTLGEASAADGFSARAAVGVHPEGIDIVVEVEDATHIQNENESDWWRNDSLQIGVDCDASGWAGGNTELIAALTPQGPGLYKLTAADPRGDIPSHWTPAKSPVEYADVEITHEDGITRYAIRLDWGELYPLAYDPAKPLYLAFVVNDSDGGGRDRTLEWGGGIAGDKSPSLYGKLKPPTASAR